MARILIIDDEEQMRGMLRQMLERAGYEVIDAADGKEGMKLFRREPADLIITDLLMPEKEGLETIMELRREFPGTKIIAISGGGREGILDFLPAARKLGACATLAKPFERQEMLDAVAKALGKSGS